MTTPLLQRTRNEMDLRNTFLMATAGLHRFCARFDDLLRTFAPTHAAPGAAREESPVLFAVLGLVSLRLQLRDLLADAAREPEPRPLPAAQFPDSLLR